MKERFERLKATAQNKVEGLRRNVVQEVREYDPRLTADEVLRTMGSAVGSLQRGANTVIRLGFQARKKLEEVEVNIEDIRGRVAGFDRNARDAFVGRTKAKVQRAKEAVQRHVRR